jgi:hypothetical protein
MYVRGYLQGSENGRVVTIGENPCDVYVNIEESPSGKSQRTQDLSY